VHPPRPWIDDLLAARDELVLDELRLRTTEPYEKASALGDLLDLNAVDGSSLEIGGARLQFVSGGPEGRPELFAERFL
jgi:hypothetical protein